MPSQGFEYRFRVRLHDIDAAGVMFYGHLFRYAHDAYEGFMGALGVPLYGLIRAGRRLPLVHAAADYLMPLRHGEEIGVEVGVETLSASSFTLAYGFRDGAGILRARARTVHVHLAADGRGAAPLPEWLRAVLATARSAGQAANGSVTPTP
jgi:1,4-dihydroxy-2-naphthoyl-CoA hydrolase